MINEQIRDREVRLVGENGEQLGIMPAKDALKLAKDAELDLVKIAPTAKPPVCKIIDYGKYRYELARKEKEAKKKQAGFPHDQPDRVERLPETAGIASDVVMSVLKAVETTSGSTSERMQIVRPKDWWKGEYKRTANYNKYLMQPFSNLWDGLLKKP